MRIPDLRFEPTLDPTTIHVDTHAQRPWEHPETFQEIMAEQLRHAPWLFISIIVHAVVFLILWQVPMTRRVKENVVTLEMQQPEPVQELVEPEPEELVEPELEPAPDPTLQDAEVPEIVDTQEDDFTEEELSEVDSAFDANAFNDVIGIGGGAGGKFGGRGSGRRSLGRKGGRPTAEAIGLGLNWLRDHQEPDGSWSCAHFMRRCPVGDVCDGGGNPTDDIGITGLALLAFLGDGSTMRSGPYKPVVKRATIWLKDQQGENGLIGIGSGRSFMYNHAIASLALIESYGLSKYRTLKRYAQRAVDYICRARNPYKVWRYYPADGDNDTSVTGWMVFALKSAQDFGLRVDIDALKYALSWFDEITDPSTGQCGYTRRGEGSSREIEQVERFPASKTEALTAVGLLCRIFLGQTPKDHPILGTAADTMLKKPPVWNEQDGSIDLYYWYYGSYAMYQMGGNHWRQWRKCLTDALVKTQEKSGHRRGSWPPVSCWSNSGGRVYATAIGVLCLEVYYRYSRLLR